MPVQGSAHAQRSVSPSRVGTSVLPEGALPLGCGRCCPMAEETGRVAWNDGEEAVCRWDNYLAPNFTASVLASHRTVGVQRHHRKQSAQSA